MNKPVKICEFCHKLPDPPWIYCQDPECSRQSLAKLVADCRRIRERNAINQPLRSNRTRKVLKTGKKDICPLCKELISQDMSSSCFNCQTTYHNDCLLEMTGSKCSTIGCNKYVETQTMIMDK